MAYTYVILGSGRQGTAAAYDMARWGDAAKITLADVDAQAARRAAKRVNELIGRPVATAASVDVSDSDAISALLQDADACLSAVPYYMNLELAKLAVQAGVNFCDLGGHTGIARQQHALHEEALAAGISVIPNCGQVPGMGTTLMLYAAELLDEAVDVVMWDGGLPQNPRPPYNYMLTFSIDGLVNEYAEPGVFLRDWKVTEVEPLTELELVEFPEPIGTLEAFVTGGGLDTMPYTYEGKFRTLQNKTLRYPGHMEKIRAFYDLGLWEQTPVQVGDSTVVPRELFNKLWAPQIDFPGDKDMIIVRILASGRKDGRPAEALVELFDFYDDETGFTAMERSTGWSAAIVAEMMARGETPRGAGGVESMVPVRPYVRELQRRDYTISENVEMHA